MQEKMKPGKSWKRNPKAIDWRFCASRNPWVIFHATCIKIFNSFLKLKVFMFWLHRQIKNERKDIKIFQILWVIYDCLIFLTYIIRCTFPQYKIIYQEFRNMTHAIRSRDIVSSIPHVLTNWSTYKTNANNFPMKVEAPDAFSLAYPNDDLGVAMLDYSLFTKWVIHIFVQNYDTTWLNCIRKL